MVTNAHIYPLMEERKMDFDFLKESVVAVRHACQMVREPPSSVTGVWYDAYSQTWLVSYTTQDGQKHYSQSRDNLLMLIDPPSFYRLKDKEPDDE